VTVGDAPAVEHGEPVEREERDERDERWYLSDQRDFLRRSLEDADREHEAGDLSDEDHALLVARDEARLADVEAELRTLDDAAVAASSARPGRHDRSDLGPAVAAPGENGPGEGTVGEAARTPRSRLPRWRRIGIVASCLLIALGAVILVVHFVQAGQPGQPISGSVSLSQAQKIEQQLNQALAQNDRGNTKAALELYDAVLAEDPSNPAALAYAGYLQWNVGSTAHVPSLVRIGRAEIQTAVKDSPTYYEGHLFYGLVLANQDHNDAAAVVQFNQFLADDPPAAEPPKVGSLVAPAYAALGQSLPSAFAAASTTTTAPAASTPSSAP
jgi:tetratricopeptide (TPR) repeat protein